MIHNNSLNNYQSTLLCCSIAINTDYKDNATTVVPDTVTSSVTVTDAVVLVPKYTPTKQTPYSTKQFNMTWLFLPRDASTVLAMALCPCVCPSQVGVLLKRLNVGSHKQHHTIAQGL